MTKKVEFSLEAKLQMAADKLEEARAEQAIVTDKVKKYYNAWEKLVTEQINATDYTNMTPEMFKELSTQAFNITAAYKKMNAWIEALHPNIHAGGHWQYSDEPYLTIQLVQLYLTKNQETADMVEPLQRVIDITAAATGCDEVVIDILERGCGEYDSYKIVANVDGWCRIKSRYNDSVCTSDLSTVLEYCSKNLYARREDD